VTSNDSVAVRYEGTALTSDTDYRWSVTWWDDQGVASEPSSSTFSIALLEVSVLQTHLPSRILDKRGVAFHLRLIVALKLRPHPLSHDREDFFFDVFYCAA
jgi:hypothetical protein